jgi:hypothetical protein
MIGYGAGLQWELIVTLEWRDILFSGIKYILKMPRAKKNVLMLPYSIVNSLEIYKSSTNNKYVFWRAIAGEPNLQERATVMRQAIKKSGLEKKPLCTRYVTALPHTY